MIFKSDIMNLHIKSAVGFLTFKKLEEYKFIQHAFSTRLGGVSKQEYKSMNLRIKSDDEYENIIENYKLFCDATNIDFNSLVLSSQSHSRNIRVVSKKDVGVGIIRPHDVQNIDGLTTNERGITLVTFHADCIPVIIIDMVHKAIGIAHAGWRGTLAKIAEELLIQMKGNYFSNPKEVLCFIGPGISKCCFEIGKEIIEKIKGINIGNKDKYIINGHDDKTYLDLPGLNKQVLIDNDVCEENIILSDICTSCYSDMLFSHRKMGERRGTMAAMIQLL